MKKKSTRGVSRYVLFQWADFWPGQSNALFTDGTGAYWLGNVDKDGRQKIGDRIEISEALKWYAQTAHYGSASTGDIGQLCQDAGEALERAGL